MLVQGAEAQLTLPPAGTLLTAAQGGAQLLMPTGELFNSALELAQAGPLNVAVQTIADPANQRGF